MKSRFQPPQSWRSWGSRNDDVLPTLSISSYYKNTQSLTYESHQQVIFAQNWWRMWLYLLYERIVPDLGEYVMIQAWRALDVARYIAMLWTGGPKMQRPWNDPSHYHLQRMLIPRDTHLSHDMDLQGPLRILRLSSDRMLVPGPGAPQRLPRRLQDHGGGFFCVALGCIISLFSRVETSKGIRRNASAFHLSIGHSYWRFMTLGLLAVKTPYMSFTPVPIYVGRQVISFSIDTPTFKSMRA